MSLYETVGSGKGKRRRPIIIGHSPREGKDVYDMKDGYFSTRRAIVASVSVAFFLALLKIWAFWYTGSVAILSGLIDSLLDLVSSLGMFWGVRQAFRPADADHRFGHGKAEPLSALFQGAFLVGASLILMVEAAARFFHPRPLRHELAGAAVIGVSLVVTALLVLYQRRILKRTGSLAVQADNLHYTGDFLINLGIIGALGAQRMWGLRWVDPLFGGMVALFLLRNAVDIGRRSLKGLMDAEFPDSERGRITETALEEKEVLGVHDLRTHRSGPDVFIQLHIEVPGEYALSRAHAVGDRVEDRIRRMYPAADIIVHQDPGEEVENAD